MICYETLMKRCIQLAKNGRGFVSPNPLVGCVVLDKDNNIISEGYHHKYGENHAERDALSKLKNGEEEGGTLIVNLEPCSHWGKTPPCTDLIIERGIKKVVIGCQDTNPKVAGNGIKKLKEAGITVIIGVLEKECKKLNEIFFCNIEQKRIFTVLKTATTIDGKISTSTGDSKWITSEVAREKGHILRGFYDAILTSSSTVLFDNPEMRHNLKIILDKDLKTNFNFNIYKTGHIILVTKEKPEKIPSNVEIFAPQIKNNNIDLVWLLKELYQRNIKSVFIEAGGVLAGTFIRENLVDKIYQFIAPKILNDNNAKSCFDGDNALSISQAKEYKIEQTEQVGEDLLITYISK